LEKEIREIEKKIKTQKGFVIYGSDKDSAWFDYLRGVTRRVERKMVKFYKTQTNADFTQTNADIIYPNNNRINYPNEKPNNKSFGPNSGKIFGHDSGNNFSLHKSASNILRYINRLSSYFYALERFVCYNKKIKERSPWY
jgi:cob(I)alamin adenosyltransferase